MHAQSFGREYCKRLAGTAYKPLGVLQLHMSLSGLCELCDRPDVDHTCGRCGHLVCDRHFDTETGVCVDCLSEVRGPGEDRGDAKDRPDGVDTYRF